MNLKHLWMACFLASVVGSTACGSEAAEPCGGFCESGVCNEDTDECVAPWQLTCPEVTGQCSSDQPYMCDSEGTPSYDCETCGCPTGFECEQSVCYEPSTLSLLKTDFGVPDDLPLDDYFKLYDMANESTGITYEEFLLEADALLRADARRTTILLGESHNSADEQAVGVAIMRDLKELGWPLQTLGLEGDAPGLLEPELYADIGLQAQAFGGSLTNDAHCQDALAASTLTGLNHQGMHVQYTGSGHTSQEVCHFNANWSVCNFPHVAECVLSEGRKSLTVILLDPNPWLWQTDNVLFWRIDTLPDDPTGFEGRLDEVLTRWDQSFDAREKQTEYDATVEGRDVNVRFVRSVNQDDVFFAYFPRPARPPYMSRSYRVMWDNPELQAKLIEHGIGPKRCSVSWNLTPGEERISMTCRRDGYQVLGTLDGVSFELLSSSHGPEAG